MNVESRSKWQIRLATLSIFLLGFVAGAFAINAYHLWFGARKQPTRHERFEEVFNQIGATDAQKAEIQKTVGETREKIQAMRQESEPRLQEIRRQNDERMQQILTPEQWQKFQIAREKIYQSDKPDAPPKPGNSP